MLPSLVRARFTLAAVELSSRAGRRVISETDAVTALVLLLDAEAQARLGFNVVATESIQQVEGAAWSSGARRVLETLESAAAKVNDSTLASSAVLDLATELVRDLRARSVSMDTTIVTDLRWRIEGDIFTVYGRATFPPGGVAKGTKLDRD